MPEAQVELEFTEAELTGVPEGEPGTVEPSSEPEPTKEADAEPAKEPVVEPAKEAEPEKPPKGYVSHAALHSERMRRQELQAELEALRKAAPPEDRKDPSALILEDPEESVRALMAQIEDLRGEMTRKDLEREIKSAVPDFFDKAPQMEELLLGEGMTESAIRSMIGSVGREAPVLFKVLDKLVSSPNETALRTKLAAELTPQITAEVTKALMAKFNITDPGVNIGRLPGTPPSGKLAIGSEAEFGKLSPEQ